jgi:hypothetical protein
MHASMVSGVVRDERENLSVIVSVHGRQNPTDADWDPYVASIGGTLDHHGGDSTRIRGLSITTGGGPTTLQRDRLNSLLAGRSVRVAVVTPSKITHGIVTALSWFNPMIRAFSPARFADAIRYLELPPNTQRALRERLKAMRIGQPDVEEIIQSALAS